MSMLVQIERAEFHRLHARIEALEDVMKAVETVARRLRIAATLHTGDEHPVLETAMLDLSKALEVALQRLQEGQG